MKHPLRDEVIIATMMAFGQGHRYIFGKGHYKPVDLNLNELSHSKTRMKWMNRVNRKRAAIHLGGPTFRWVHLCLNAIKALPKNHSKSGNTCAYFTSRKRKNCG